MINFFSNFWNNFKEYIVLTLLVIISISTLSLNNSPAAKNVKSIAFGSFAIINSVVSDILSVAKIKSENERLKKVNAHLMLELSKMREYGIEINELKKLLVLKDTLNLPLAAAKIVSKSLNKSRSNFTINVGEKDSIKPGMPVINDQGLVGVVFQVSDNYSIVRTLRNLELKLAVKDERSRLNGIMKWDGDKLIMTDVSDYHDIKPGDRIITSDLSYIISYPVPVGIVIGLEESSTGIFKNLRISPFVDFDRIETVFVIRVVKSVKKENIELNLYNK